MVLLNDERIAKINCTDNGEKIISLMGKYEKILVDESRSQISSKSDLFCYAREFVIEKLIQATDYLPEGYKILVKEAYRTLSRQKNPLKIIDNEGLMGD